MSCFNALANCCPTEPPPENCCLELSDIATLFPNGASLVVGGVTFTFSAGSWYKEGCCLYNTSTTSTGAAYAQQCTSDWTYQAEESVKCIVKGMKKKLVTTSFNPAEGIPDLCSLNECQEVFVATQATGHVLEKGERVVASKVVPISATLVVGKYLRTCAYGESVCTYVVGVTLTYAVYAGSVTQGYKTWTRTLDSIDSEVLTYCLDGMTLEQAQAGAYISHIEGQNDFPLCNYIDDPISNSPQEIVTITRGKLLTTWNCPLTFTDEDIDLDFCNWIALCIEPGGDQGPITVTFNRTLPPVYVAKSFYALPGYVDCCRTDVLNTFPNPKNMYEVVGPNTHNVGATYTFDPPPPGQEHLDPCFQDGLSINCVIGLSTCVNVPFGCYKPYPENTIFLSVVSCCFVMVTILSPTIDYHSTEYADYSFSYNSVTDSTPIVHTYNIPAWTLNC